MMKLGEYLSWKKLTPLAFATLVGVSRQTVTRWRDGSRKPDWDLLPKIIEVTGGKVTADSFVDDQPATNGRHRRVA